MKSTSDKSEIIYKPQGLNLADLYIPVGSDASGSTLAPIQRGER